MVLIIPVLVTVLGVLVYVLAANPKASEAGRLAFFAGLFVTLLVLSDSALKIIPT